MKTYEVYGWCELYWQSIPVYSSYYYSDNTWDRLSDGTVVYITKAIERF
jgi:hypothetical protein